MSEQLLEQILEKINTLAFEQAQIKQAVLESNTEVLEFKQAVLETNTEIWEIKQAVLVTNTEIWEIKQAVLETNTAVLEIKETVNRIESVQDQQHRIIELLSSRSIDHEATLKHIK